MLVGEKVFAGVLFGFDIKNWKSQQFCLVLKIDYHMHSSRSPVALSCRRLSLGVVHPARPDACQRNPETRFD